MEIIKYIILLANIFCFNSDLFSQNVENYNKNVHELKYHQTIFSPSSKKLEYSKNLNKELISVNKNKIVNYVIWTLSSGKQFRSSFLYNSNNKIVLESLDTLINNQWTSIERISYNFDIKDNLLTYMKESKILDSWVTDIKESNIYDHNDNLTTHLYEHWIEKQLVYSWKATYTYDSVGNNTSRLLEDWNGNQLVNNQLNVYSYDSVGNLTLDVLKSWVNNEFVNDLRISYQYDSKGYLISYQDESFSNGIWYQIWNHKYTYDNNGNKTSIIAEHCENNVWVNSWKFSCTYNASGNETSELYQIWKENTWENDFRILYVYDSNGNKKAIIFEKWETNFWYLTYHSYSSFDTHNRRISSISESWDNGQITSSYRYKWGYDLDGDISSITRESKTNQIWVYDDGTLGFADKEGYFISYYASKCEVNYIDVTENKNLEYVFPQYSLEQNYPNPFNPVTNIKYSLREKTYVTLTVFNILGEEVATLINQVQGIGSYVVNFDSNDLPSGIYVYTLATNNFIKSKKMIILK